MSDSAVTVTSPDAAAMTARLVAEGLIGLAPASRLFGTTRNGRPKHPSTLTRYHHGGVRCADGQVVRLECVKVGSQLMTSRDAVLRFIAAQQNGSAPPGSDREQLAPPPATRRRAAADASAQLAAALGVTD